jgi:hypothetical protein
MHKCRDRQRPPGMAEGMTPGMEEVEPRREQRPRATQGAVAGKSRAATRGRGTLVSAKVPKAISPDAAASSRLPSHRARPRGGTHTRNPYRGCARSRSLARPFGPDLDVKGITNAADTGKYRSGRLRTALGLHKGAGKRHNSEAKIRSGSAASNGMGKQKSHIPIGCCVEQFPRCAGLTAGDIGNSSALCYACS